MTIAVAHLLTVLMLISGLTGSAPGAAVPSPSPRGPSMASLQGRGPARERMPSPVAGVIGRPAPAPGTWPLRPRPTVVAPFSPPLSSYGPGHRGVDLAGRAGQEVRAAAAGRVTFAGALAGRGVVVVTHGTTRTTYEPVHATVRVGTVVAAGEVLGRLQPFASHCAPAVCLHWGLIEGETYLDPLTLVGGGPVRLLPLS